MKISMKSAVAAYFAAAEVTAPPAAAEAQRHGSSAREKSDMVWSASAPLGIKDPASPTATAAVAITPPSVM